MAGNGAPELHTCTHGARGFSSRAVPDNRSCAHMPCGEPRASAGCIYCAAPKLDHCTNAPPGRTVIAQTHKFLKNGFSCHDVIPAALPRLLV